MQTAKGGGYLGRGLLENHVVAKQASKPKLDPRDPQHQLCTQQCHDSHTHRGNRICN